MGRLHVAVAVDSGISCAENLAEVIETVLVTARGVVVAREGVASPEHDHFGPLLEHVNLLRAVVLRHERCVFRHRPRLVFARIVGFELLVLRDDGVGELGALVVEDTCHLGPALHER